MAAAGQWCMIVSVPCNHWCAQAPATAARITVWPGRKGRLYAPLMINDFLKRLLQPEPDLDDVMEHRLALTSLLVRLARTDGDYAASEMIRIEQIAMARFGLTKAEAAELRAQAEDVEAEAPDTVRFTRAIKEAVPYDERIGVVEGLWQVALADGARDQDEDALVRLVTSFLGVSDRDSALARQRVAGEG